MFLDYREARESLVVRTFQVDQAFDEKPRCSAENFIISV